MSYIVNQLTQRIVIESSCTIINQQATFYCVYEMFLESANCISEYKIHCIC